MSELTEIYSAIEKHEYWKYRLVKAIENGESVWVPSDVKDDTRCEFGKWLYSLTIPEKESEYWKTIRERHEQFHIAAANVLQLAIEGQKNLALSLMNDAEGEYRRISIRLKQSLLSYGKMVIDNSPTLVRRYDLSI